MTYIKSHPYGIEELARNYYGTTDVFEFAGYLLEDGTMLNFSHEGHQRDEDHRNIGFFFAKAQGTEAMLKFMRRGNIRCKCNQDGYRFEFVVKPTKAQFLVMQEAYHMARQQDHFVEFFIEKDSDKGFRKIVFNDLKNYLEYYDEYIA